MRCHGGDSRPHLRLKVGEDWAIHVSAGVEIRPLQIIRVSRAMQSW